VIGRGGNAYPVDIRIASSPDVSREHARIRRDPGSGIFYLIDLSSFGTTLDGRHVPAGCERLDGVKRENVAETALPDAARMGLAGIVFLDFRRAR
jgi:predicted component of type VI protein secretion system